MFVENATCLPRIQSSRQGTGDTPGRKSKPIAEPAGRLEREAFGSYAEK